MGAVEPWGEYQITTARPEVTIGGAACRVLFSGLVPGWPGLYIVNVEIPAAAVLPARIEFRLRDFLWSDTLSFL